MIRSVRLRVSIPHGSFSFSWSGRSTGPPAPDAINPIVHKEYTQLVKIFNTKHAKYLQLQLNKANLNQM